MPKKKKYAKQSKTTIVSEPAVSYQKGGDKSLRFFSSFEEMNEADAKEMAQNTPIENLRNVTEYISQCYAEELKNKMTDLTIHFKKPDAIDSEY